MRRLESSFDVMEPADLLQWLRNASKTGVCRFQHNTATRRLYLEDGRIIACSSNEPHLLLGQFLISNGRIDATTLQTCMKLQEESGENLGRLLVGAQKISKTDLERLLTAKAEETVFGLFDWPEAKFCFDADHDPPSDAMRVDLDIFAVVMEGSRRRDEIVHARTVFHSPSLVLHKTQRVPDEPTVASHMGRRLYESINGKRTLGEIILYCRVSEYLAYSFLVRLVERELIRVGDIRVSESDVADEQGQLAVTELRELMEFGEYEEALELISRRGLTPDGDDLLSMLVAKAEAGFLAKAYRTQVPPDSTPQRVGGNAPPKKSEGLTNEEFLLLDLVEGKWDVRSLVWVSPMRKVDVVRGLVRLERAGHITFQSRGSGSGLPQHASKDKGEVVDEGTAEVAVGQALDNVFGANR
jgi:hypothetical protein